MVEHNLSVVADLSDRITVLARGEILAEGAYAEVASSEAVVTPIWGPPYGTVMADGAPLQSTASRLLWRVSCAAWPVARRRERRGGDHYRPQRGGQDHDDARDHGLARAAQRIDQGQRHGDDSSPPEPIARLGVGYVPEDRGIYASLDVTENLLLPPKLADGGMSLDEIYRLFPNLEERRRSQGTRLSGGEQQMLAIARVLRTGADSSCSTSRLKGLLLSSCSRSAPPSTA